MPEFVTVTTQRELDRTVADGNIPICRAGFFKAYNSATVRAYDSATVRAYDSATVRAYNSATVRAYNSATVEAYDSATVRAYDSATVEAYNSATVRASDSATVRASPHVAVHRLGNTPTISGGVLIQVPECGTAEEWIAYYGLAVSRGSVVLFKAVDQNFRSSHGADYTPGTTTTADDFDSHTACGNGQHFSPRPFMAQGYHHADATRFVACRVKVADIVVIDGYGRPGDKVKARSCKCLYEVDVDGEKLVASTERAA